MGERSVGYYYFCRHKKASPNGKYNNCYMIHTIISEPVKLEIIFDLRRASFSLKVLCVFVLFRWTTAD